MSIHRAPISAEKNEMIHDYADRTQRNENGQLVSPNGTGQVMESPSDAQIGHQNSFENRYEIEFSEKAGISQEKHNELFTNPGQFQMEPSKENASHKFENHDHNDGMQNVSAYAASEDKGIASNMYINPPSNENEQWSISIVNAETGEESQLSTFTPDFSSGNDMSDFSSSGNENSETDSNNSSQDNSSQNDSNGNTDSNGSSQDSGSQNTSDDNNDDDSL